MMIDKNNYEAYVLDYLEGNLTPEQSEGLFAFLDKHPELDVDLDLDLEFSTLPIEEFSFESKSSLLRTEPLGELSVEEQLIALVEGDLEPLEVARLELQLQSSEQLEKERALFTIAKLKGESVVYPFKALLLDQEPSASDVAWAQAFEGDNTAVFISEEEKIRLTLNAGSAVYDGKSALKQGTVIPLYTFLKYAGVAAAIVIGLFVFPFDQQAPASAYKPYENSGFPKVELANQVIESSGFNQENVALDEEHQEQSSVHYANYNEGLKERDIDEAPAKLDLNSRLPEIRMASYDRQLVKGSISEVDSSPEDIKLGLEPVQTDVVLASNSDDFVPIGTFIKGRVFNKLNLPSDVNATEGISALASRATEGIAKRTNNKITIQADKKLVTNSNKKRKFKFRIGNLLIRRD